MFTRGVNALRALCRFASPLPRPGPRCSNVAAGRPVMRAYPSAAPVATPSKSASTLRISVTSSSAATKCISDVPGFMKHVSTPQPTSVRISACAPFMLSRSLTRCRAPVFGPGRPRPSLAGEHPALAFSGRSRSRSSGLRPAELRSRSCPRSGCRMVGAHSIEDGAGVEDAVRVEGGLDATHEGELRGRLELLHVPLLLRADAVLARDRAAELHPRREDVADQPTPRVPVGLEDGEVHVAVARVTAADDQRPALAGQLTDLRHVPGDRRARHHHVDDVVGTGCLRGPEG